jgi:hypothetical protein
VRSATPVETEEVPPPSIPSTPPPRETLAPADADLEKLLAKAFTGDPEALSTLEQRPLGTRSVREWLALGRGRARVEKHLGAMQAYQQALGKDPSLGRDPAVQRDVAQALKDGDAVEIALDLAARYLGTAGADMLYHAWVETREVNATTQMAKRLLQSEDVRGHASPGLEFLLEWREAMSCEDYRRLLPRAPIVADTRAVTLLSRLESKNDCQLPEDSIAAAISAARGRPGPTLF